MIKFANYQFLGIILGLFTLILPVNAQTWRPVRSGILYGISGMALIEQQNASQWFLIVHDNKKAGEPRIGRLGVRGEASPIYEPLEWLSEDLPIDLEAITRIPQKEKEFLALASGGRLYHLQLSPDQRAVRVLKTFSLPEIPEGHNFEGLALQEINGVLVAVWVHRGNNQDPAVLYWSKLDLTAYQFSKPFQSVAVTVPYPKQNVRHISDLKIDSSGAIFITSAMDQGNEGLFSSAFYLIGVLQRDKNNISFLPSQSLTRLLHFDDHKIEAFEFLSGEQGGIIFGTDDENFGSFIDSTW